MNYKLIIIIIVGSLLGACKTDNNQKANDTTAEDTTNSIVSSVKDGPVLKKDDNGVLIESSTHVNGQLHGEQKLYEKGVLYSIANYNHGTITGKYQSFYANGEVYVEGEYKDGAMNGKWKTYYESSQLKEIVYFVDNEENGAFVEFHTNGSLKAEGEYLDGDNEHGELFLYNPNGVLIQKMNCDKGICRTSWRKEGNQGFPEDVREGTK